MGGSWWVWVHLGVVGMGRFALLMTHLNLFPFHLSALQLQGAGYLFPTWNRKNVNLQNRGREFFVVRQFEMGTQASVLGKFCSDRLTHALLAPQARCGAPLEGGDGGCCGRKPMTGCKRTCYAASNPA